MIDTDHLVTLVNVIKDEDSRYLSFFLCRVGIDIFCKDLEAAKHTYHIRIDHIKVLGGGKTITSYRMCVSS